MEEKVAKKSQGEIKTEEILEPTPQPDLGSYYNLLEGVKIIPWKFVVPLFFELDKERIRTHTWMKITKSKGIEDIGHMEEMLKE